MQCVEIDIETERRVPLFGTGIGAEDLQREEQQHACKRSPHHDGSTPSGTTYLLARAQAM